MKSTSSPRSLVVVAAVISIIGGYNGTACAAQSTDQGNGKVVPSITWAISLPVLSLDPGVVYDSGGNNLVTFSICDPLLRYGPNLSLEVGIAQSWTQSSPTSYVYTLRPNVKFWDGKTVTPEDVAFSLNRIQDPKLASPLLSLEQGVDFKQAIVSGPTTVTVELNKPNPMAQWLPATPVGQVVEKAFVEQAGANFGASVATSMCSGPYKPVTWTKGAFTTLVANGDYWDKAHQPHIDKVRFEEISDRTALVAGLRSGEIDGTFDLAARDARSLDALKRLVVLVNQGSYINYVAPNMLKGPFSNSDVRHAFSIAIDRNGLAAAVDGKDGQPLKGPVTPGIATFGQTELAAAYAALPLSLTPQLDAARALMKKSGYNGAEVQIEALAGGTTDTVGAILQAAGSAIGLNVSILKMPSSQWFSDDMGGKEPRPYDAFLAFWAPDFSDQSAELVPPYSSVYSNIQGFQSAAYDQLRAQWAASKNGSPEQLALLIKMEQMIIADTVVIPLNVSPLVQVHKSSFGGYDQTKLYYYQQFLLSLSGR